MLGVLLALVCRVLVSLDRPRAGPRRRQAAARRRSREVADELVVEPVRAELAAYDAGCARALAPALS